MNYVYIVTVQPKTQIWEKISQEGYLTLNAAQNFVLSRSDKPEQKEFSEFLFESETNYYRIYEIQIKGE